MKVVFISAISPYPIDNGKKVVISGIVEYLESKYGKSSIEYISFENDKNISKYILKKPGKVRLILNLIKHVILFRNKSIQESVLYSKETKININNILADVKPDMIIVDTIRMAQFIDPVYQKNSIVYLDDLFSIRYEKMLATKKEYPGINLDSLGNFKKNIPDSFTKLLNVEFVEKNILKLEKKLVKNSEINVAKKFPLTLLINRNEVKMLKERSKESKSIKEIKPHLKVNNCKESIEKTTIKRKKNQFIFLGSLNIAHNSVSILNFLEKNMDRLINEIHDVKIIIIGKNASEKILKFEELYPEHIEVKGYVEDLNLIFDETVAMIIPLLFGTGVKLKTLDAMARGLPIISTSFGVEGISIGEEGSVIVEDTIESFPKQMKFVSEGENSISLSTNSKELFNKEYSKERIYKDYDELFNINNLRH